MLPNKQKKKRKCVEEQFTKFAAFTQPVAIQIIKNEKNGPKLLEISFGEVNLVQKIHKQLQNHFITPCSTLF